MQNRCIIKPELPPAPTSRAGACLSPGARNLPSYSPRNLMTVHGVVVRCRFQVRRDESARLNCARCSFDLGRCPVRVVKQRPSGKIRCTSTQRASPTFRCRSCVVANPVPGGLAVQKVRDAFAPPDRPHPSARGSGTDKAPPEMRMLQAITMPQIGSNGSHPVVQHQPSPTGRRRSSSNPSAHACRWLPG